MQVLRFATRAHIEAIFGENHALWGVPLTPDQYRDHWFSLFLTPWGSSNFRYMALTDEEDGPLLSTLKLYRFTGRLYGEPVVIAGIGAVYTPAEQRTYGSASLLVSEVLDYMQKKRAALALLFSDIGVPFYERLGFIPLPSQESSGPLPKCADADAGAGAPDRDVPGVVLREAVTGDARRLASLHQALTAARPLVIERDAPLWEFILFRRKSFWSMAPASSGQAISLLALREDRVVAMGFAVIGSLSLRLQEAGCLPGEEASLRAIIDRIWSAAVAAGAREWRASLPRGVAEIDERLQGDSRPTTRSIPMSAPLGASRGVERLASDPAFHLDALDHV